ncbi:MAG: tryptophan--tRNA ligase [Parcubacteria group bacterium]|nr:tryptophan--tRNA ligase [Parcubacteria group bacterium]
MQTQKEQPIALTGVKPTGRPHVGNYFGAMKPFVDLQSEYQTCVFIADLHALTTLHDKEKVREYALGVAMDYVAIGVDPEKTVMYRQSDIPEIAELSWIFSTLTTMPYLMRAHAFKDAEAKNKEVNVGTFCYPILMAADILIQDPDIVPVGKDQNQHVEIARDTAAKFNHTFGTEMFKTPKTMTIESVATVPGIDGQKMSKSYGNTIPLFADDETLHKAIMSIVTDSKSPEESKNPEEDNIFALHKLFSADAIEDIARRYREGGMGYKESKDMLYENVRAYIAPLREKREAIAADPGAVKKILDEGGVVARERAVKKLKEVHVAIGLDY